MATVKLKIVELRKMKGIGQQDLADVLGVSYQSVSKWETGTTMPDISLLPSIADYFNVSVDELLGLKPLGHQIYIPRNSDNRDNWNGNNKLYKNRKYFFNNDYLTFLIKFVWHIETPIDVLEFRCGEGYFGEQLLDILPKGSTYTGIDNEYFTNKAKDKFQNTEYATNFIASDIYTFKSDKRYDLAVGVAALRHLNRPMELMKNMIASVKKGGLVACIDVNREFENVGLYLDDIDYAYLCTAFDFHKSWKKELEYEGRDYAIGMRLPYYMQQLGLHDIDIRMNDRVIYVNPDTPNYDEMVQDFIEMHSWDEPYNMSRREGLIEYFMNRGDDRTQAEAYITLQTKIADYFKHNENKKSFSKAFGLLIAYGRK